jgi:hypothetical protein
MSLRHSVLGYFIKSRVWRAPSFPSRGRRIFPLSSVSRPALGPIQPSVQWVPGVLSPGLKSGLGVTLTTHPHLVTRLRMNRSYTPLPPSAYRRVVGQLALALRRTASLNMAVPTSVAKSSVLTVKGRMINISTSCFDHQSLCILYSWVLHDSRFKRRLSPWRALTN